MRNRKLIIGIIVIYIVFFAIGVILLFPYAQAQILDFLEWNTEIILPLFFLLLLSITFFAGMLIMFLSRGTAPKNDTRNYGNNISVKRNFVFVLTPFHPDFENTYKQIREICQSLKLSAMRSDEEFIQTDVLKHIVKNIVEARVIIANIDGRNANVFYELGIAHALNKPTILVSKIDSSVPFDVQGQYIVLYNSESELKTKLHEVLLKVLTSDNN